MGHFKNSETIKQADFIYVKSHEMKEIVINKNDFLKAVKLNLKFNIRALRKFTKKEPVYVCVVHETINGNIKIFGVKFNSTDCLGNEFNIEEYQIILEYQLAHQKK